MNDPFRRPRYLEPAFIQAEGELRSKAFFRVNKSRKTPPDLTYKSPGVDNCRRIWSLIEATHFTIRTPKTIQSP